MNRFAKNLVWAVILCGCILPAVAAENLAASVLLSLPGINQPGDVVVSEDGRIFVLEGVENRIRVYSAKGEHLGNIPSDTHGKKGLRLPTALGIDSARLYVADTGNHRISVFDLNGRWIKEIKLSSVPVLERFDSYIVPQPTGIALDGEMIYWSDRANHQVCLSSLKTGKTRRCWGQRGEKKKDFQFPFHLSLDADGYLYVVDVLNARIAIYNRKGKLFSNMSRFGLAPGLLFRPNGLAFSDDGRLFVSDSYRGLISVFKNGKFKGYVSEDGIIAKKYGAPVGLFWKRGQLYIADALGGRVQVIASPAGDIGVITGQRRKNAAISSRQQCVMCHLSWGQDYTPSEGVQDSVQPVSSRRMCYSCHHGAVIDSRSSIGQGGQHPDIHHPRKQMQIDSSARKNQIPEKFPLEGDKQLYCASCHTPHQFDEEKQDTLYLDHQNGWMRVSSHDGKLCQKCHENKLADHRDPRHLPDGVNHPVGVILKAPPQLNAKGYATQESLQHGLPSALEAAGASLGNSLQLQCQSCHQIHGGEGDELLITGFLSTKLCASCHHQENSNDKKEARRKGIHPVNIILETTQTIGTRKTDKVVCLTCHSAHGGRENSRLMTTEVEQVERLCESCHERQAAHNKKEARSKGVHVVNVELEEPVEIAGKKITRLGCLSCHSVHQGKPGTPALRVENRNGQLCKTCHQHQLSVINSDHDLRITAKQAINRLGQLPRQVGVCGSCHSMHRGDQESGFLSAVPAYTVDAGHLDFTRRDALCLSCHRKKGIAKGAVIEKYTHPWKDMVLRSDPKKMPLQDEQGSTQQFGMIACITCHNPHRWTPRKLEESSLQKFTEGKNREGTVLNSFLTTNKLEGTFCIDCHGKETLIKFKYFHDDWVRNDNITNIYEK